MGKLVEFAGVSYNQGSEKSRITLKCLSEANPRETRFVSSYQDVLKT